MKISTDWLNDYVDLKNISNSELANKLTMTGTKVETFSDMSAQYKNIVIGKILSIKKHPNADSLFVCSVDIKTKTVQIITSATNIKTGALIPVCLDGSVTANGIKIKKSKLRGELSDGMMCSLAEVGLSQADYPYAIENGIFLIEEENCKEGQNFSDAFNLNDTIFDFEITSNRPDCLSAVGIAREIHASFNISLKLKCPKNYCEVKNDDGCFKVENQTKKCLRYMAKLVKDVKVGPSPSWLKKRLKAADIQSINNIVDITNYVMIEYGIPMHAFDITEIEGEKIIIRQAKSQETIDTLMHTTAQLLEEDIVVCDSKKPLAVAGVIGGAFSGINEDTKTVVFEVACFDGSSVRKTSQRIAARTQSSLRFEKGLNPICCEQSLNRACELVELLNIGIIDKSTTDIKNYDENLQTLPLNCEKINKLIGFSLSCEQMVEILNLLDFKVKDGNIQIPPYRIDIKNDADIAEEVARIYGYNNIESTFQSTEINLQPNELWSLETKIKNILTSLGFNEIYSYSFSNKKEIEKSGLNFEEESKKIVEITNPFGEDTRFLKTSTIPTILNNLSFNLKNGQEATWLFEIGRIYEFDENKQPKEPKKITLGFYDQTSDFFTLKGALQALFKALKIDRVVYEPIQKMPFHDYIACEIKAKNVVIGECGEIHPKIKENFKLNRKTFVAVLDLNEILKLAKDTVIFKPFSKFPESVFDLTVVCDENLNYSVMEDCIKHSLGDIFKCCSVFSIYHDEKLGVNKKSISFNIKIQTADHTLTKAEIEEAMKTTIDNLQKIGASLRA